MQLALLIFFPLVAAAVVGFAPAMQAKRIALTAALAELVFFGILSCSFDPGAGDQFLVNLPWVPGLGISFKVALDGISFLLVLLLCGCANPGRFHHQMQLAARPEPGIQQTQLAHLGQVVTDQGIFQVATQSRVLTGMMAPRGIATRLLLFD